MKRITLQSSEIWTASSYGGDDLYLVSDESNTKYLTMVYDNFVVQFETITNSDQEKEKMERFRKKITNIFSPFIDSEIKKEMEHLVRLLIGGENVFVQKL